MRAKLTTLLMLTALLGVACDTPDDFDTAEPGELEASPLERGEVAVVPGNTPQSPDFASLDSEAVASLGWTEAPLDAEQIAELGEIIPPPEKGTCGGYWDHDGVADFQGCGSCWHTIPNPDRPGNKGVFHKRWCWTGGWGCTGCEPWIVSGWQCYDNC